MVLQIQDIKCGYGDKIVVDGFSTSISKGNIFCLLGPNGIGKTTLFKTILGFLPSMGGKILLDGRDISRLPRKEFARIISYVPQAHTPPFAYSVIDVVMMGRIAHLGSFASPGHKDVVIADRALERLGIESLRNRAYTELSGGERQMVMISRALAQESAFLMMDEPTASLDFGNQVRVIQITKGLAAEGLGIIMTTHFPDHVFQCNASVALMLKGYDYLCGTANDVLTEENLMRAYGISVAITDAECHGNQLRFCQPIIEK
ncbi:MAG: ABC transporter ATP-binding protein [Clostridiaceae bacterium]|nr:ABC transporter ATP-binding protein [Clostridiaceae bacterium]